MSHSTRRDPAARSKALRMALDEALATGTADAELIAHLTSLHMAASPEQSLSSILASAVKAAQAPSRSSLPDLTGILFEAAKQDGFQTSMEALQSKTTHILANRWSIPPASVPSETCFEMANSPWAHTIGLLLNEAAPKAAALWPFACAMAGAAPAEARKLFSNAPKPSPAPARDALLLLACETRDPALLDLSMSCQADGAPSRIFEMAFAKALAREAPHAGARHAMNLAKRPAREAPDAAGALCDSLGSASFARAMLSEACLARFSLPEGLPSEWTHARKSFAAHGASELGIGELFEFVSQVSKARLACAGAAATGQSSHRQGDRSFSPQQLDELSLACLRKALAPRSRSVSAEHPPLAFRLLTLMPSLGPLSWAAASSAIDSMVRDGFSKAELSWMRSESGHTQSIASAACSLIHGASKEDASLRLGLAERWLGSLAAQGFNFEAKATPKSKSIGERLRSVASLKPLWPGIESRVLAFSSGPAQPSAKKRPAL